MIAPAAIGGQDGYVVAEAEQAQASYNARRAYAYALGEELALKRKISADAYLFLYKELVRLCKDRAFCWPGLHWLAERLSTSVGTVKRWMEELVSAGLIRRKPRPGGLTTLTVVAALDTYDAGQVASAADAQHDSDRGAATGAGDSSRAVAAPPLFFMPRQEIKSTPPDSAQLIRQTIKRQKKNPIVVECDQQAAQNEAPTIANNAVTEALQAAGLTDPQVINELRQEPLDEIQAIIRYVARQRHIDNPPGLIVALARTRAGAGLTRSPRSGMSAASTPTQGGSSAIGAAPGTPAVDHRFAEQLRGYLREQIAPETWNVWFADLGVLDITEKRLVIAVPNCLVRDHLQTQYLGTLIDAGTAILGRRVTVELAID